MKGDIMPKLYYRHGCMSSSKTANALMTKFNYEEKGYKVLLLKPSIDNRDSITKVKSRIGLESEAILFQPTDDLKKIYWNDTPYANCIIVDEAQFLTAKQVEQLKDLTYTIPVFCYGLRSNFKSYLFEGSKRLFELADSITELKSICKCGNKAIINAKYKNGKIVYDVEEIDIGGNEKYIGMCYKCWRQGKIK